MIKIKLLFLEPMCLLYQNVIAQDFSSRKETVENILNTIINSTTFDSIYLSENELLTKELNLIFKETWEKS